MTTTTRASRTRLGRSIARPLAPSQANVSTNASPREDTFTSSSSARTADAGDKPLPHVGHPTVPQRSLSHAPKTTLVDARLAALRTYESKRVTHIELDHKALAGNVAGIRAKVGASTQICAVVKANAYGHGAVEVARVALASGADRLAVATVAEAVELRRAGIDAPILVLGYTSPAEARDIVALDVTATVSSVEAARALADEAKALGTTAKVHVKVNTGMNRLGVSPADAPALVEELAKLKSLDVEGIFTHFHSSDSDVASTRAQLRAFTDVLDVLDKKGLRPRIAHAANSDAVLTLEESHLDMVRPGTALYGMVPGFGKKVLSWKTSVAHVNPLKAAETVSYGATWTAPDARTVAVIPVGWADGLAAGAGHFREVLVGGVRCPIVGSITMDQAMVDVTALEPKGGVKVGDEVVLLGAQKREAITVEEAARWLGDVHPVVVTTNIRQRSPSSTLAAASSFDGWSFRRS